MNDDTGERFRKLLRQNRQSDSSQPGETSETETDGLMGGDTGPLRLSGAAAEPPVFGGGASSTSTTLPGSSARRSQDSSGASSSTAPTWPGDSSQRPSGSSSAGSGHQPANRSSADDLPQPVNQVDEGATHVSPAAYQPIHRPAPSRPSLKNPGQPPYTSPQGPASRPSGASQRPYPQSSSVYPPIQRPPVQQPPFKQTPPRPRPSAPLHPPKKGNISSCLLRAIFFGLFTVVLIALCALTGMFYEY
jgi:hypothetical protein